LRAGNFSQGRRESISGEKGFYRPAQGINHVGYTVADFDREKAKAELKSLGAENVRDGGLYSLHMTDPFGYDVQISGLANNALTDG
jgi:hypothetical protein